MEQKQQLQLKQTDILFAFQRNDFAFLKIQFTLPLKKARVCGSELLDYLTCRILASDEATPRST